MRKYKIGTRGSALALWQATFIENNLRRQHPDIQFERVIIKTEGDRDQKSSLSKIGGQGVFTKSLEDALSDGRIDIAVHSLKDLPSTIPNNLRLAATPQRGRVEDVLITKDGKKLTELPEHAVVATGSIRRRAQLLHLRPDLQMRDLRGNIDTRLRKLLELDLDAIIMARAALLRLQLSEVVYSVLSLDEMIPAIGQGAIGVQIRADDKTALKMLKTINHLPTFLAISAERSFLRELDSGCQFPVGAYASVQDSRLSMIGFVSSSDGKTFIKDSVTGQASTAEMLGRALGQKLIAKDALQILKECTNE